MLEPTRLNTNGEYVRDYTISLWDLQDSFIAVLKYQREDILGTIENPIMKLVDDGTRELSLTIPMYVRESSGVLKENPIWYNVMNGNLIANMRKLKVIFNMGTDDEAVFEFLITKVTESHENHELKCEITAEGLAFHELGKQGYKIALEYENFEKIYDAWEKNKEGDEPIANLQFWNEENGLGLLPYPGDDAPIDANTWYYDVQMDWSSYSYAGERSTKVVYEEEYTPSWRIENHVAIADAPVRAQEKARIVNLTDSNYYNLTQDLAKEFGIFCKYKYKYDDNYHIIGRIIVYYNNFINEQEGTIDFTYPYSSSAVTREMDGTDLITKMYVDTIEDESVENGTISILNTDANLSGEDYILNFEYMYKVGALNKEQYDGIKKYETNIGELNKDLTNISNKLISYGIQKPKTEAMLSIAKAGIQAAEKGRDENASLMKALDLKDGKVDGYITSPTRTANLILKDNGTYSLNLTEKGVLFSSVAIYSEYSYQNNQVKEDTKLAPGTPEVDEFGNLIRINNLICNSESKVVYVNYDYDPKLYYQRIIDQWNIRLAKDQAAAEKAETELAEMNAEIARLEELQTQKIAAKKQLQIDFAKLMGAALREGSWKPDNYKNCENKVNTLYNIGDAALPSSSSTIPLIWDDNLFEGEEETYYKLGVAQQEVYYPYIPITSDLFTFINTYIDDQISIIYYDYEDVDGNHHELARSRRISLGSGCQLGFKLSSGDTAPTPVIVITAAKSMSDEELDFMEDNGEIGVLNVSVEEEQVTYDYQPFNQNITFSTFVSTDKLVQPRFKINTMHLKTGKKNLYVRYNDELLEQYYDYSTLSDDGKYYITIKPRVFFEQNTLEGDVAVTYTLSNASTAIYLDAKQVLKENSVPKVSYTVEPCMLNVNFMHTAYNKLNRIININDYELKFENVQGYISSIELNLDKPFEDKIQVKNYKTKFEDLFTSIVASTEQMQKNANTYYAVSQVLNPDGTFKSSSLQEGISNVDLNYAFNNGTLSITNENGIIGLSENGVVAMRGGGIFTATDKDTNGDWIWNTGITPQGINAQLITTGQLDTNRIVIYAGDEIRFQMNDKGLYAYKTYINDEDVSTYLTQSEMADVPALDKYQYVVHNGDGLFLCAEPGATIIKKQVENGASHLQTLSAGQTIKRVSISWDGLTLRNWNDTRVFYADADTGDLTLSGTIRAASGEIAGWIINPRSLSKDLTDPNTNEVTHLLTISPDTGINFGNKFIVDENGYLRIVSGSTIFKATSTTVGFYNYYTTQEQGQSEPTIHEDGILTLTGSTLNVNGAFDMNATGNLTLNTNNVYINSNAITLHELPTDTTNQESIDEYYNIYTLGNNLLDSSLANRVSHIQYSKHRKIEYLENPSEPGEQAEATYSWQVTENNYVFSIGDKFTYIFDSSNSNLNITGDLTATTLTVGETNSIAMSYDSSNGLLIGDTNGSYLQYDSTNGLIVKGNITGSSISSGSISGGTITGSSISSGTISGTSITTNDLTVGSTSGSSYMTYDTTHGLEVKGSISTDDLTVGTSNAALTYNSTNGLNIGGFITYNNGLLKIGTWHVGSGYLASENEGGIGVHKSDGTTWAAVMDPTGISVGGSGGSILAGMSAGDGHIETVSHVSAAAVYVTGTIELVNSSGTTRETYATQEWVQQQGYISSLTGYATETWASQSFLDLDEVRAQIMAVIDKNGLDTPDGW